MTGRAPGIPRPDWTVPCMVKDVRYRPPRWGVLRRMGPRAGLVQFGSNFKTDSKFVAWAYLQLVTPEEIEEARQREAEGLV